MNKRRLALFLSIRTHASNHERTGACILHCRTELLTPQKRYSQLQPNWLKTNSILALYDINFSTKFERFIQMLSQSIAHAAKDHNNDFFFKCVLSLFYGNFISFKQYLFLFSTQILHFLMRNKIDINNIFSQ